MSFAAKSALPIASDVLLRQDAVERASAEQIAVFLENMRTHPRPAAGWSRLFSLLRKEYEQRVPDATAIVLENAQYLNATNPVLSILATHFLPALPPHTACFLISEQALPLGTLPSHFAYAGVAEMRVDAKVALRVSTRAAPELPSACVERLVSMSEGRAGALADILASVRMLSSNLVQRIVGRAKRVEHLMGQVAGTWLQFTSPESQTALAMALRLGYCHSALLEAALDNSSIPAGPWLSKRMI